MVVVMMFMSLIMTLFSPLLMASLLIEPFIPTPHVNKPRITATPSTICLSVSHPKLSISLLKPLLVNPNSAMCFSLSMLLFQRCVFFIFIIRYLFVNLSIACLLQQTLSMVNARVTLFYLSSFI